MDYNTETDPQQPGFKYKIETRRIREEAAKLHYSYSRFLMTVCGGVLALSAPLQVPPNHGCHSPVSISLLSLLLLGLSVFAGGVATYGEKRTYDDLWTKRERLLQESNDNASLANEQLAKEPVTRASSVFRAAFHIQWPCAAVGFALLLVAKWSAYTG